VIADETRGFDHISAGYHGPLYAEISPRTFPVLVREGSRLSQIRFRRGNALLDGETLRALHARERLVTVGVDLSGLGPDGMVGYRAKRHSG
jgi:dCTP deaminase